MNRRDLQVLSRIRLREARALAKLGMNDGAYYLAGYCIECALKACIARSTLRHDFPDKKKADLSYTHKLRELLTVAGLEKALIEESKHDVAFRNNWGIVQLRSERSRYGTHRPETARKLSCGGPKSWNTPVDKAALISVDLEKGSRMLRILDDAGLRVNVVLWAVLPEYEDSRLVLSSRKFDVADLRKAYGLLHDALDAAGFTLEETPPVVILRSSDPFVKDLRRYLGQSKNAEGMRLGGQMIGDRFIEDAYAYRVA